MPCLYSLRLLFLLAVAVLSEPTPGRIPKVYNALITSNQNLEPSKAYPVYQPVIHDTAFAFPFSPAVYYGGDFPLTGLGSLPALKPKEAPSAVPPTGSPADERPEASAPPTSDSPPADSPPADSPPANSPPVPSNTGADNKSGTPAPPLPPNTESPIPLNQFGLPSQVFPLGRFDPAYDGFTQVGPYYSYPSFKFYDPYDPFNLNPYASLPSLYRPLTNVIGHGAPSLVPAVPPKAPEGTPAPEQSPVPSDSSPPPEPSDLNVLNYSAKDPSIPNVEPPPLPSGGLKDDKSE